MRLLIWTEGFWPRVGGVESYLKQFIPEIRKRGYEVAVVTPQLEDYKAYPEEDVVEGAKVYRLPFYDVLFGKDPAEFFALRKRIEKIRRDFKPDLIQLILFGPSVLLHIESNKRDPIPTLVAIHSDLTRTDGLGNIAHRILNEANHMVTVSAATLEDLTKMFPQIQGKSSFIHNGLVTDNFKSAPMAADSTNILCIGRLVALKGFDIAIETLAQVRRTLPTATLTIVGDGEERSSLEQKAESCGLKESVNFTGWLPPEDVYKKIGESAVVLIPSQCRETFSLVAVEAALMGRPVVATRAGGLEEVVIDQETGFLVDMDDTNGFAERLENILGDAALRQRLGASALHSARNRFSIGTNAASYDELYRNVIAESRSENPNEEGTDRLSPRNHKQISL